MKEEIINQIKSRLINEKALLESLERKSKMRKTVSQKIAELEKALSEFQTGFVSDINYSDVIRDPSYFDEKLGVFITGVKP